MSIESVIEGFSKTFHHILQLTARDGVPIMHITWCHRSTIDKTHPLFLQHRAARMLEQTLYKFRG